MQKKKITLILLCILLIFGIMLSVIFPTHKYNKYSEKMNTFISIKPKNEISRIYTLKNDKVDALYFYNNDTRTRNIELEVSVYQDNVLLYQKVFAEINSYKNSITFEKKLENSENIKIVLKNNSDQILRIKSIDSKDISVSEITAKRTYISTLYLFITYIIVLSILLYKNKKNIKSNKITDVLYYFLSFFTAFYTLFIVNKGYFVSKISLINIIFEILLVSIILYYLIMNIRKKISPERIFLILTIPLVAFYTAFNMPEDAPDEFKHYGRAYSISEGNIVLKDKSGKYEVPQTILADWQGFKTSNKLIDRISQSEDYSTTKTISGVPNTYFAGMYIFSTIAIMIVKFLGANAYYGWYLGKILHGLLFMFLGYHTVKKMPSHKLTMILYLLMPYNLYQAVSISPDAVINSTMLFLIAYFLQLSNNDSEIRIKDWILFVLLSIVSFISKPIYIFALITLIYMLRKKIISNEQKKQNIKQIIFVTISFGILVIAFLLFKNVNAASKLSYTNYGVGAEGVKFIINNPFFMIWSVLKSLISNINLYTLDIIGYRFGWQTVSLSQAYPAILLVLLVISSLIRNDDKNYKISEKIMFTLSFLSTLGLTMIYLSYAEYRSDLLMGNIVGVCGRYFIPVFIFVFLTLPNIKTNIEHKKIEMGIILSMMIIQLFYIYHLINWVIVV